MTFRDRDTGDFLPILVDFILDYGFDETEGLRFKIIGAEKPPNFLVDCHIVQDVSYYYAFGWPVFNSNLGDQAVVLSLFIMGLKLLTGPVYLKIESTR